MTRIPLREARGPFLRASYAESKRRYGKVPDPVAVKGHTPELLAGYSAFELATMRARRSPPGRARPGRTSAAAPCGPGAKTSSTP